MTGSIAETPLTLDALGHWSFPGTALAVLGHPIRHSISPPMHNAALAELARHNAIYSDWKYFRFDIPPDLLAAALPRLHEARFAGLNLTVPHKVLACGLVNSTDADARDIGAVNTLIRTGTGWRGANTDGFGLASALREELSVEIRGTPFILLGAGGAARGAAVECLRQRCAALWIANRTPARLAALLETLRPLANAIPVRGFDPANPPASLPPGAVVINATSAGLKPSDPAPIDLRRVPSDVRVFDMIYNPPKTALLRDAESLGLRNANGLSMLVYQGARSLELWTGARAPVHAMAAAAASALTAA